MSAPQTPHRLVLTASDLQQPADRRTSARPLAPVRTSVPTPDVATSVLAGRQVLVVGAEYAPTGGDCAPYTTAIADHLATVADGVTVLTAVPQHADGRVPDAYRHVLRTAEPGWYTPDDPRVIRLRRYSPRRRQRPAPGRATLRELSFLVNAASAGRRLTADLVIGVTPGPAGAAAAAWLATRLGAPLVTIVQALPARTGTVCPGLERYALRHSTQVAVASESFRDPLVAAGVEPERLHLLPTWSRVRPTPLSRAAARHELGWAPERFVAVHAGPQGHRLDGFMIVEAARLLADLTGADRDADPHGTGSGVEIVLVGDGSQRAALEQQAFGLAQLRFVDPVDDDTLPLVLAAADVLIVAETCTGRGANACVEPAGQLAGYLGAGRPVLAATPAGSPTGTELRRAGGAGVRVEPGDPLALCRALLDLRSAPERRAAMGRAALRYARGHLGREASLRRLDVIVAAALAGHGAAGRR